jgi:hypothetical protein
VQVAEEGREDGWIGDRHAKKDARSLARSLRGDGSIGDHFFFSRRRRRRRRRLLLMDR